MRLINVFCALLMTTLFAGPVDANYSERSNGEWTTISGEVTSVAPNSVTVKTKRNSILVEMDDYDMDADGYKLVNGDKVTVTGRVDQDFLEKKKIEASSVYVKGIDTYFFANPNDEEDLTISAAIIHAEPLKDGQHASLRGKVTEIDGREFILNTGLRNIKVDTSDLFYNPMDNKGITKVDVGDTVRVSGEVDDDFFHGKELEADYIYEIGT